MRTIKAGRLFDGENWHKNVLVQIEEGRVLAVEEIGSSTSQWDEEYPLLVPGFIDVHVNGGGDALFNHEPTLEALRTMLQVHARYGTVAMVPTLISDEYSIMKAAFEAVSTALKEGMNGILGLHYEGPYLNPIRKGVHNEDKLRAPDEKRLKQLLSLPENGKLMVTLAPEQVDDNFIPSLVKQGVIVCVGHSAATYDQAMAAVAKGVKGFTHLYNAMSPLTSREPGVVGAALHDKSTWCGLIADGHHVHPASMAIAIAAKGADKIMLVTDAIQSVGSNASELAFLGRKVIRHQGRVTTEDGTLAGSDLDMATAVRNAVKLIGVSEAQALQMASLRPAEFLGLSHELGRIRPGYRASLVALDDQWQVLSTWIDGEHAFVKPS